MQWHMNIYTVAYEYLYSGNLVSFGERVQNGQNLKREKRLFKFRKSGQMFQISKT